MSHSAAKTSSKLSFFEYFITYAFYPLLLATTLGLYLSALQNNWNLAEVFVWMAAGRILLLLTVEFWHPAKPGTSGAGK